MRAKRQSTERLYSRCTVGELKRATKAAAKVGETLSEFVRVAVEMRCEKVESND